MRTRSEETSPEIERVKIELIRKASIAKRFEIMQSWSQLLGGRFKGCGSFGTCAC